MKKKKTTAKAQPAPKAEEDWLGEEEDGDDDLGLGSEDDEDADVTDEDEEADDGDDGADEDGEAAGDDADGDDDKEASRILARVAEGKGPQDLNALKQEIENDAGLLSNWRKAKQLGEKRPREEVFRTLVSNCSTYFGYSEELAEYFLQMFSSETAIKFFEANEQHRPLTIRTNSLKARRSTLMQALNQRKVQVDPIGTWTKVGLKVYSSQVPVGATPEYLGGHYMIQSASSFVPVMALAPQQDEIVLDMAAAPGGKTTYIGQLMRNTGTLFANDLRRDRCKALVANIHRMGLTNAVVTNMDGKKLSKMLPKLDRVLLDAPCTGSGIIARDPSVKVKRGQKDFEDHSKLQKELLQAAIDMVDAGSKTGGYIVYSTCSVSVEENESVVDHVLKTRNVELVSFSSAVGFGVEGLTKYRERRFHSSLNLTRRYYPHVHNMDGFFVAKLKKTSNTIPERTKKDRTKSDNIKVWGEEKWTPAMMESVMDFGDSSSAAASATSQKLTKIERKKLKRAATLKARGFVPTAAQVAEANAAAPAVQPAAEKRTDKKQKRTAKAGAAQSNLHEPSGKGESATAAEPSAKKKLKKKKTLDAAAKKPLDAAAKQPLDAETKKPLDAEPSAKKKLKRKKPLQATKPEDGAASEGVAKKAVKKGKRSQTR
eukprot:TRINITY_DN102627_c0_g1_i1.p1 TRINITY_DN102627_c0_g1~~TRINITY_DN102627_c0_g1_i1.p1  ORF type:complete len:670 (+),score=188.85 TRINITY_DN102627_c0_g1_i1:44-2011(+)